MSCFLPSLSSDTAGNETVTARDIVQLLHSFNYDLYVDHWNEQHLYFGRHHKDVLDIDALFGSKQFRLPAHQEALDAAARRVLSQPVHADSFDQRLFLKTATDVIAIERALSGKMKKRWGVAGDRSGLLEDAHDVIAANQ
jgi:hypothetical protein